MSLDVAYSYCINLTEQEKQKIDKQVKKNRRELKLAIFFFVIPFTMTSAPFFPLFPVAGFSPQQIIRNARNRAESAVAEKMAPLAQVVDDCEEAYNEYKEIQKAMDFIEDLDKKWEKLSDEEKYESTNIKKCQNHLFYDIHRLDRYESLGEPTEVKRFDANENQARAWIRLEKGTHTKEDLTWLKHEKAEQWYEQKHDAGYSESHEKAESHWSGTPWTDMDDMEDEK